MALTNLMYAPMEYITDAVTGIVKRSSPSHSVALQRDGGAKRLANA
jgi:hypothetical protein